MTMRLMVEKTPMRANRKIPEDYRPTEDEPFMSNRQPLRVVRDQAMLT